MGKNCAGFKPYGKGGKVHPVQIYRVNCFFEEEFPFFLALFILLKLEVENSVAINIDYQCQVL